MHFRHLRKLTVAVATIALTACGGGSGTQVVSVPPPPVTPTPTPPPPPPIAPAHLGLVSNAPFAVLGTGDTYTVDASGNSTPQSNPSAQTVQFSYDDTTNTYFIGLPGLNSGRLVNTGYSGSSGQPATSSTSQIEEGAFGFELPVFVTLPVPRSTFSPYTYTSYGWWDGEIGQTAAGDEIRTEGYFAYGIPTQAGDVPITGSASYSADIHGSMGGGFWLPVTGGVNLQFDFAGGTLSGSMHPEINDSFDGIFVDFGQYDFTQTVYSTGSTSFSGKFIVPGLPNANSSFEGNFTGPHAAELMGRFEAPFLVNGTQGTIAGIWVGSKN